MILEYNWFDTNRKCVLANEIPESNLIPLIALSYASSWITIGMFDIFQRYYKLSEMI